MSEYYLSQFGALVIKVSGKKMVTVFMDHSQIIIEKTDTKCLWNPSSQRVFDKHLKATLKKINSI